MLHRTRHLFIRQQTAVINSIRAHLAEGRRVFFDIAAERLLADRQIGGGALQVEPGARLAKLGEFSRIKLFADMLF